MLSAVSNRWKTGILILSLVLYVDSQFHSQSACSHFHVDLEASFWVNRALSPNQEKRPRSPDRFFPLTTMRADWRIQGWINLYLTCLLNRWWRFSLLKTFPCFNRLTTTGFCDWQKCPVSAGAHQKFPLSPMLGPFPSKFIYRTPSLGDSVRPLL